jgi:hypothetical protein
MADRPRERLDDPPENTIPKRRKRGYRGYRRVIPPEKRRPTRSKLDNHPDRPKIEREIALGVPIRQIAIKYGTTKTSINRLRDRLPPQLKAAILAQALRPKEGDLEKLRIDESEGILGNLAAQRARLLVSQDLCLEAGEFRLVATISNVLHRTSNWWVATSACSPSTPSRPASTSW